ncbi:glucose-1-phosphate adenylyltransferase subunit GlgD [Fundicoccus culcitae]|uniref:Glucose-1-phosphate adenylyltransferase subunit GlgD n=1 Tax=Fundicoccus culcitae TaxID=2969821 RepID=A0ABY5P5G8_9LACT|nr:glucose-1-phosphate adenylyltransferase subunit GlgD [Fundicoccus culcitae]UUX33934.1 glucose-1-phosphate adenylyltransferase subunit GlgD [Fundicoccus culcitae]
MVKNKLCAIINLTEDATRLKPLTNNRPIAALPFASRYRIIDFVLSNIAHAGIDSAALFIAESGRSIYDHIRSGDAWNLDSQVGGGIFTFSQQNWKSRHHLEQDAEDYYFNHRIYMKRSRAEYVFVTGSKILANIDIKAVRRQHVGSQADITLIYKPILKEMIDGNHPKERVLSFDTDGYLTQLHEVTNYPDDERINASLSMYLISVEKMNEIIDRAIADGQYMELDELIQHYVLDYKTNTYEYTGYAANISSIEQYYRANMDMLDRSKFTAVFHSSLPILTKTKNGSPTYYDKESNVKNAILATDCLIGGEVVNSIINRKVRIAKQSKIRDSIILQGTKIGEGAEIEYAIIDKDCVIEPGAKVIGTPDNLIVIPKNTHVEA